MYIKSDKAKQKIVTTFNELNRLLQQIVLYSIYT